MSVLQPGPKLSVRKSPTKGRIAWIVAVVFVALLALYAFGGIGSPSRSSITQTASTTYDIAASSVVLSAAQQYPAGYNATSSGTLGVAYPGEQSAAYAILSQSQSDANVTVLVFNSTAFSQSYYDGFTLHVQGLPGYTDITSLLSGYQRFGSCYAYGEDVDGIAVANGICKDGNVFLEAHISSSEPFAQLEEDLSVMMGTMYQDLQ